MQLSRTRVLLLAPVLAAGILTAGAGSASADTNCVGALAVNLNEQGKALENGGLGGRFIAFRLADVLGVASVGEVASTNNCTN